jgi:prolyl-tRNA editing enzyme YbaK/EbsC (Cys-tRNA(Pro) deacylase)
MHPRAEVVAAAARAAGVEVEVREFPEGTRTAADAAAAIGVQVGQIVGRANADEVRAATGFAIGGVPPFAHASPLDVYVDADLLQHEIVWAAAGTPHHVFAISPADLVRISAGTVCQLASA